MFNCEKVFRNYSEKVYGYLRQHISNQSDIEDLHSHIFFKIVQYAPNYRGNPNAVSSFVYTITRNSTINFYKSKKHLSTSIEDLDFDIREEKNIEDELINQQALECLASSLEKLSPIERNIIIHCYYNNMTLKEAAIKNGISYGVCKNLHRSALKKLKDYMKY